MLNKFLEVLSQLKTWRKKIMKIILAVPEFATFPLVLSPLGQLKTFWAPLRPSKPPLRASQLPETLSQLSLRPSLLKAFSANFVAVITYRTAALLLSN